MWGLAPGRPFNVEYPDHFLSRVKDSGVFDNLKNTRAETKINAAEPHGGRDAVLQQIGLDRVVGRRSSTRFIATKRG